MHIFGFTDYKKIIKEFIKTSDQVRGYKTRLAKHAGCQKSFLSLVLNSHVHITPDHAVGMAKFWNLNTTERDYFLELVHFERAATRELKTLIKGRLDALRIQNEDIAKRYEQPVLATESQERIYYSTWYYSAIHILLTIPEYRTTDSIARRLELPALTVRSALDVLQKIGLAQKTGETWKPTKSSIHLPRHSPLTGMNHHNWRERAIIDSNQMNQNSIHYTSVVSISDEDFQKLREKLFEMIDSARKIVEPSKEQKLVCLLMDLFEPNGR